VAVAAVVVVAVVGVNADQEGTSATLSSSVLTLTIDSRETISS